MQVLKQSTTATILVGPVLDSDGAAYASAVIGDFNITKNGSTAALAAAATATHSHNGMYLIALTTGNTDTLGRLDVSMSNVSYAMTNHRYEVLTSNQFDALVTNGTVTPAAITTSNWAALTVDHTSTGSFGAGVGYIITTVAAILVAVNTLTSRISSGVATMFADLIQMITGSGTVNARFTTKALENAPGGGDDTGARSVTVTVTLGGNPLEGATVRLSKGAETKVKATDVDGEAAFNCDDGAWTVAITAANASFQGATLTVDGDETPTYAMTADSITPSSPTLVTGYWVCYDQLGVVETGVTITAKCVKVPTEKGFALDSATRTATSGAGGLAQFTNLIPGATYEIWRGTGLRHSVKIADDATGSVELNSILGS